jgi:hypothetical protein
VQKYGNVPAVENVCEKVPEVFTPESQRPFAVQQLPDVVECEMVSWKFHCTVPPTLIAVALVPLCVSVKTIPGPTLTTRVEPPDGGVGVGGPGGAVGVGEPGARVGVIWGSGCVGEELLLWQADAKSATAAHRTVRGGSFMITSRRDSKSGSHSEGDAIALPPGLSR